MYVVWAWTSMNWCFSLHPSLCFLVPQMSRGSASVRIDRFLLVGERCQKGIDPSEFQEENFQLIKSTHISFLSACKLVWAFWANKLSVKFYI